MLILKQLITTYKNKNIMKYLKLFEDTLKHSDPLAINHSLRDFSRKIEDVVIVLKNLDNLKDGSVKRFFNTDGHITIIYRYYYRKLLKISLIQSNENVLLIFRVFKQYFQQNNEKNTKIFNNLMKLNLNKYKIETPNITNKEEMIYFNFPLTKINIVLKKIEEYYIEIESKKYNL